MKKHRTIDAIARVIIGWTFIVTAARAIRLPNDFSEAHWLLDYRFGFIKRGLIGSLCNFVTNCLGLQMNPRLIVALSFVIFCSMSAAVFILLYRMSRQRYLADDILVLGAVFASSPFVVMSAHLLGYFDALLYVCAIASVALTLNDRPLIAALVSVLAIASHESYLVIGFPLVCLASVAMLTSSNRRFGLSRYIIALSLPIAAFVAISVLQNLTTDAALLRNQITDHLNSFGFVPTRSRAVANYQTTTFLDYFRQQSPFFIERLLNPVIVAAVGPSLITLLFFAHTSFGIRALSPSSLMVLSAGCAPLAMHAVAWDTARISTYLIGGAFIVCWILSETRKAQERTDNSILLIAFFALILNIFNRIPLMDARIERFSNMLRLVQYLPVIVLFFFIATARNSASGFFSEFRVKKFPKKM